MRWQIKKLQKTLSNGVNDVKLVEKKDKSDSFDYYDFKSAIIRYVRRISEINEELGAISETFLSAGSEELDSLEEVVGSVNKLRVPGYYSYKLTEEGILLLHLLLIRVIQLRNKETTQDEKDYSDKLEHFINQQEDMFKNTLEVMSSYKNMDGDQIINRLIQEFEVK